MKLLICGDICPTSDYRTIFNSSYKELFGDVLSLIKNSDYAICNLECPATDSENKTTKTGPNLKAEVRDIKLLKEVGFNAVSIGNNHILDYGEQGVIDTLNAAKDNGISVFGGGINIAEAQKPLFVQIKEKTIGFMAFAEHEFNVAGESSAGANLFDPYVSLNQISDARKECDFLVVLYHGGIEHFIYPTPMLQKKCRAIANAGADIVLCQHSHCIGTMEKYGDSTIVYGQGNCIFGYRESNASWNEGLVLELDVDEAVEIKYHLIKAASNGICIDKDEARLDKFFSDSERLTDSEFLQKEFSAFCKKRKALDLPLFYGKNRVLIKLNRILKGKLFKPSKRTIMITHNLIRCDAWNEVIQETLRSAFNDK